MAAPAPAALSAAPAVLAAHRLDVAVAGRVLVRGLELEAVAGDFIAVLGRNGVGKTLTLHTLAGLRPPAAGAVLLDGRAITGWPDRERARRISLLPQATEDPFPATVFDAALIGRHPHLPFWQWEGADDHAAARGALASVDLGDLAERAVDSLSGGEKRRLDVATLLAQDTPLCLLDEPTNHLDPRHRREVLALFRARTGSGGTVFATLHDASQAVRVANRALLLFGDGRWRFGDADEVMNAATLSELYGVPVEEITTRTGRAFISP
jgi:iron complex transport system ATP-binding protein